MRVDSKAYQEHELFEKLDKYAKFYDYWSDTIMHFITAPPIQSLDSIVIKKPNHILIPII